MRGQFAGLEDVNDAINLCLVVMFGVAASEDRSPAEREYATLAVGHLERAKRRVEDTLLAAPLSDGEDT